MSFDPKHAQALAAEFAFPRIAGTAGERRAADLIERHLRAAGLDVDRGAIPSPNRTWDIAARLFGFGIVAGGLVLFLLELGFRGRSLVVRIGLAALAALIGAVAPIAADAIRRIGQPGPPPWDDRPEFVAGTRPGHPEPPVRVVFLTRLETRLPSRFVAWRAAAWIAAWIVGEAALSRRWRMVH